LPRWKGTDVRRTRVSRLAFLHFHTVTFFSSASIVNLDTQHTTCAVLPSHSKGLPPNCSFISTCYISFRCPFFLSFSYSLPYFFPCLQRERFSISLIESSLFNYLYLLRLLPPLSPTIKPKIESRKRGKRKERVTHMQKTLLATV
jgi:hypothetical protein